MPTLVLKIPMNSGNCVDDKDEIHRALWALVAYTSINITDDELRALMDKALRSGLVRPMVDKMYEIVEDAEGRRAIARYIADSHEQP